MEHTLIIEEFGKIKKAQVEISPLTLFVGDNNSGKSYLLSLICEIYSADASSVIFHGMEKFLKENYLESYEELHEFVRQVIQNQTQEIKISSRTFADILNGMLQRNKDRFAAGIFNSEQVSIGMLAVMIGQEFEIVLRGNRLKNGISFSYNQGSFGMSFLTEQIEDNVNIVVNDVFCKMLLWFLKGNTYCSNYNTVYLPAARTGFMLAKNVINRVGREIAYDAFEFRSREEIQPFTKPVIQFLNMMEALSLDCKSPYEDITAWMEASMICGKIQYGSEASESEIRYLPDGGHDRLPLRTSSAVVTELTPLLLLLKYKQFLNAVCYEEPEMCLHPRLQQEMGKLLVRLVNSGICVAATTHSDIMIQHINNMCRLWEMGSPKELMERLELSDKDVIDLQKVAIYQFTDLGEYSVVEKVVPEDGEFRVKTFSNALMEFLEQTTEVQDFEGD